MNKQREILSWDTRLGRLWTHKRGLILLNIIFLGANILCWSFNAPQEKTYSISPFYRSHFTNRVPLRVTDTIALGASLDGPLDSYVFAYSPHQYAFAPYCLANDVGPEGSTNTLGLSLGYDHHHGRFDFKTNYTIDTNHQPQVTGFLIITPHYYYSCGVTNAVFTRHSFHTPYKEATQ